MSWCDSLASTPIVGVRFDPLFRPSEEILSGMSTVLSKEITDDKPAFSIESMDPFSLIFNTESGFRYTFDHSSVSVGFNHRIRAKAASAGPPTMELLSQAAPYTDLLVSVVSRLLEAIDAISSNKPRTLRRVGIVSLTQATLADTPPGIIGLFAEIGNPLGGKVESFSVNITTEITKTEKYVDKCVHTLTLPEPPDTLVTLQLDWQRKLNNPSVANKASLSDLFAISTDDALSYFERVAEGGLNDVSN